MGDFCTTRTVTARKTRQCPECHQTIQPGESYTKHAGSWDGDFFSAVQCQPCTAFGDRYMKTLQGCGFLTWDEKTYPFGSMIEHAAEMLDFDLDTKPTWPERREAILALFDGFDEAERAYWKRERENRKRAEAAQLRRISASLASISMVRGMSACSALPVLAGRS